MSAKPSVGSSKGKGDVQASPEVLGQIHEIMVTGDISKLKTYGIDGAEELLEEIDKRTHKSAERSKSSLRRAVNRVRNSTFGTIAEVGATVLGTGAGVYLAYRGTDKFFKKRKSEKLAMLSRAPGEDTILEDA